MLFAIWGRRSSQTGRCPVAACRKAALWPRKERRRPVLWRQGAKACPKGGGCKGERCGPSQHRAKLPLAVSGPSRKARKKKDKVSLRRLSLKGSLSRCKEEERKSFFLWDALWPGKLDLTGGASQSCEGHSSPRKPPYLAGALCSGTQGTENGKYPRPQCCSATSGRYCKGRGKVVWRRQLHGACNLGPKAKPDRPLSSGRLPQGGIVAAEGKKKASPLAPRRKSVPEGRGMQGGALRAFATPSEAPPCGFWA